MHFSFLSISTTNSENMYVFDIFYELFDQSGQVLSKVFWLWFIAKNFLAKFMIGRWIWWATRLWVVHYHYMFSLETNSYFFGWLIKKRLDLVKFFCKFLSTQNNIQIRLQINLAPQVWNIKTCKKVYSTVFVTLDQGGVDAEWNICKNGPPWQ